MHYRALVVAFALASPALASVVNLNIYTDDVAGRTSVANVDAKDDQKALVIADEPKPPRWRKRDGNHLVPLAPDAKSGVLPIAYEEGLTSALGPRFANVFIEAAAGEHNGSNIQAKCDFLGCGGTVIKAAPCVAAAIACKCAAPLLACPTVNIKSLCKCVTCLPKVLEDLVHKLGICTGKFDDVSALPAEEEGESDYPEFVAFSTRSSNLLAYRGDLPLSTLSEAKAIAAAGLCPGAPCGSCKCCLGVCVPFVNECLGVCLPFSSDQADQHHEL